MSSNIPCHTFFDSPVGRLTLIASETALLAILWENERPGRVPLEPGTYQPEQPILQETCRQLQAYFAGERTHFDLPLAPQGTAFQQRVWRALAEIPYGETRSYGELAKQLGNPGASRAVGAANGKNPLSIVLPCHRVIGGKGQLTGFAGGLHAKQTLLGLEKQPPNTTA
ncbi:MAG: methylated-DNA--[protein]-cysteine S-methyltransferase [Candidatus Sericytochromatia bacterium]